MTKPTENVTLNLTSRIGTGAFLTRPQRVVLDPTITLEEKRALLASWASDARAVESRPDLRHLDGGSLVQIDDITRALKELDNVPMSWSILGRRSMPSRRRRPRSKITWSWRRHDDDDPPTPAPAGVRPRPPILEDSLAAAA